MEQVQAGAYSEDVARSLGVDRSTVFAWVAEFREFGVALSAVSVGRLPRTIGLSPRRPLCCARPGLYGYPGT
ncbi:MAG: hypothetical protein JO281_15620 [Pseudonocardiales bacterium]|nr:hypothetical protein [Pseudonocardiales bacterium]